MLVGDLIRIERLFAVSFTIFFESEFSEIPEIVSFPVNSMRLKVVLRVRKETHILE